MLSVLLGGGAVPSSAAGHSGPFESDIAPTTARGQAHCEPEQGVDLLVPEGWTYGREQGVCELRTHERDIIVRALVVQTAQPQDAFRAAWARAWPGRGLGAFQAQEADDPAPYDRELTRHYYENTMGYRERAVVRTHGQWSVVLLMRGAEATWGAADRASHQLLRGMSAWGLSEVDLSRAAVRALGPDDWLALRRLAVRAGRAAGAGVVSYCVVGKAFADHCESVGTDAPTHQAFPTFLVGSISKLLTAAAIDQDNEGHWSDEQRAGFCACSGHSRHDLPFVIGLPPKPGALRSLALASPAVAPLGELYSYNNALSAAVGYEAAAAARPGMDIADAYADWLGARVLGPLGMGATVVNWSPTGWASEASPHAPDLGGVPRRIAISHESFLRAISPAAGIVSTAPDLARFVRYQLGLPQRMQKGKSPSPPPALHSNVLRTPGVAVDSRWSYGLGAMVGKLRGLWTVQHAGATLGFGSLLSFFPGQGIGIVVLTDVQGGARVGRVLRDEMLARTMGGPHISSTELRALAPLPKAPAGTRLSAADVLPWAGLYESPLAGTLHLWVIGEDIVLSTPGQGDLRMGVWSEGGLLRLHALDPPFAGLAFELRDAQLVVRGADAISTQFRRVRS